MVLILHKELVMVSDQWTEKAQTREAGGHAPNDQKQIQISSLWINHTGSIQMHEVLQPRLLNTVYQLLLELRGIRGGKGVLRRQGKREGAFNLRGGAICRGLMVLPLANRDWINLCLNGKKCQGRGYRGWADPDGVDKTWIRLINPHVTLQKLFHEVSTKSPNHC